MGTRQEYYITGDNNYAFVFLGSIHGQTFTPLNSHTITSVKLLLFRAGSPGIIDIYIGTTLDGQPTGNWLCSGTTNGNTLPTGAPYEWREIFLGAGYPLVTGTKYCIIAFCYGVNYLNACYWRMNEGSPSYAGGCAVDPDAGPPPHWDLFDGTPPLSNIDFMFEEWSGTSAPPPVVPTVTTQAATNVQPTSCTGNGNITDTGTYDGTYCTRRGFCYKVGTSGDPTTADNVVYNDGSFNIGAYTKAITGLSPGTGYRVRAYAVNSAGTGYGTTVQVTTLTAYIRLHTATAQRRYKAATFSIFTFPDPAGTGFTAATDGYSMLAGWGLLGVFQMFLSGTLYTSGVVNRKIRTSLAGTLTSAGTLSITQRYYKVLYGTLNLSGTLSGLRKMVVGGVLNLSGTLNRKIKKSLSGTLNSAGGLVSRRFQVLAGTLNFSGALASVSRFSKSLAGTLNLSGSLIKKAKKNLAGTLNSSGILGRKIWHKLSGTVNFSGTLSYGMGLVYKSLAGTLNLSGSLGRKIKKSLSGTVSFVGGLLSFFATFFVHRYVIEIHDPTTGALIAVLKNAYGITLEETVNAPTTLSFRSPADEAKLAYVTRANEIWVRDVKNNVVLVKTKLLRDDDTR